MILIDKEVFILLRDCSKYLTPGLKEDYALKEGFLGIASQPLLSHPSLAKFLLIMETPIYEHGTGVEELSTVINL